MTFKVKKNILVMAFILLINIVIYAISLSLTDFGSGKYVVATVIFLLVFLNIVSLLVNTVMIEDTNIRVKSLYGKKVINLNELTEISFVPLKGRILMMLSDKHNFAFISSMIDGFDSIVEYIKGVVKDENLLNVLNEVRMDVIDQKNKMVFIFLIVLNLVVIASFVYNFYIGQ
ncbi:MAG: hypothetical protein N3C60_09245 [Calditerrivibrio sp.]|nr:hypothetical protein [Calditerrivibrio sp.]